MYPRWRTAEKLCIGCAVHPSDESLTRKREPESSLLCFFLLLAMVIDGIAVELFNLVLENFLEYVNTSIGLSLRLGNIRRESSGQECRACSSVG